MAERSGEMFDIITSVENTRAETYDGMNKAIYMGGYMSGIAVLLGHPVDAYNDGYKTAEAILSGTSESSES